MQQQKRKRRYFSCLLRLWETADGEQIIWRASLEFPATGQRRGFASLVELFAFLEAETAHAAAPDAGPHDDVPA